MKYGVIAVAMLLATTALAGEGAPTRSKLNKLGLGSMQIASDHQGSQVRGRFYYFYTFTNSAGMGSYSNSGSNSVGTPLTIGPAPALPIVISDSSGTVTQTTGNTTRTGISRFTLTISNTAPPVAISPINPIGPALP